MFDGGGVFSFLSLFFYARQRGQHIGSPDALVTAEAELPECSHGVADRLPPVFEYGGAEHQKYERV